jgi:DNA-binding CsgD family transcriptional regulator
MDHVTNEPPRRAGGDKHTPQAKVDIARREQQIVALRLRGISFHEIGRVIGISRISASALRKSPSIGDHLDQLTVEQLTNEPK